VRNQRRAQREHQAGGCWRCCPVLLQRSKRSIRGSARSPCEASESEEARPMEGVSSHAL
jgi:hypothetical protein